MLLRQQLPLAPGRGTSGASGSCTTPRGAGRTYFMWNLKYGSSCCYTNRFSCSSCSSACYHTRNGCCHRHAPVHCLITPVLPALPLARHGHPNQTCMQPLMGLTQHAWCYHHSLALHPRVPCKSPPTPQALSSPPTKHTPTPAARVFPSPSLCVSAAPRCLAQTPCRRRCTTRPLCPLCRRCWRGSTAPSSPMDRQVRGVKALDQQQHQQQQGPQRQQGQGQQQQGQ